MKYPGPFFFAKKVYIYECPVCEAGLLLDIAIYNILSKERLRQIFFGKCFPKIRNNPEKHYSRRREFSI